MLNRYHELPSRWACPVSLCPPISLQVIIDSGACSCFLDTSLAPLPHIPLQNKKQGLQIHLADSSLPCSGPVTQETRPILTTTDCGHQEILCFDIICSPLFPIILGLPWLQAHDQQINWSKKEISFPSVYCSQPCFVPVSDNSASCLALQPVPDNLQHVPSVYHEFTDVFDKRKADKLPPHRSYDCPIELLPGSEIPFGCIFPLSKTELEALRSYIDENLEKKS